MAIYHLNVRGCSPATGAGAVKKAAYQSGQTLIEERTGEVCDYARKERVLDEGLALPAGVPPVGRGELWNEAERVWVEGGGGKAKREADECGRIEGAARAEQHRKDLLDCWGAHIDEETLQEGRRDHTAYQWCDLGFVPIAEARWRLTRYGGNSAWYYCSPWDVRYDPDRAKELLETGPREYDRLPDGRPYDGRPWWQA